MLEALGLASFGAVLALAGTLVQALVARSHSLADRRRELLIEAYSEFLTGLAERVATNPTRMERLEDAMSRLIAGKQKITAYAPAPVVTALAEFGKTSQVLTQSDAQSAMISLVVAMRSSVGVASAGLEEAIHTVLFASTRWKGESVKNGPV